MRSAKILYSKLKQLNIKMKKPFLTSFLLGSSSFYLLHKSFTSKINSARGQPIPTTLPTYYEEVNPAEIMKKYPNLTVLSSKAVDHLMGLIRDKDISREQFRIYSRRIIRFIIEETLALECDLEVTKQTPLGYYKTKVNRHKEDDYVGISILRSGNSRVDELLIIMPGINIGSILVQRDETTKEKKAVFYFEKLPDNLTDKKMLLLDPMLATGGSASAAIDILLSKGVKEENILFLNFVSCVEGIEIMLNKYPKMKIITSKVDPFLLPNKYIAPGLGDFGDRYYGTLKKD
jgi:uracil phosphoribosyltransferase